jgi:hypothetical protein
VLVVVINNQSAPFFVEIKLNFDESAELLYIETKVLVWAHVEMETFSEEKRQQFFLRGRRKEENVLEGMVDTRRYFWGGGAEPEQVAGREDMSRRNSLGAERHGDEGLCSK